MACQGEGADEDEDDGARAQRHLPDDLVAIDVDDPDVQEAFWCGALDYVHLGGGGQYRGIGPAGSKSRPSRLRYVRRPAGLPSGFSYTPPVLRRQPLA